MKRQNRITFFGVMLAFIVFLLSCNDDTANEINSGDGGVLNDQGSVTADEVLDFLSLKSDVSNAQNIEDNSNDTNSSGRSEVQSSARVENNFFTCAEVTESEAEGVYTTTYDYGEGCEERYWDYSVFTYGKYTNVYTYEFEFDSVDRTGISGTYDGSLLYENYGSRYDLEDYKNEFIFDGTTAYDTDFEDIFNFETGEYSSTRESAYQEDLSLTEITDSTTVISTFVSDVEEVYEFYSSNAEDQEFVNKLTVLSGQYTYVSEGTEYVATIIEPLIKDYSCISSKDSEDLEKGGSENRIPNYVSGVEEVFVDGEKFIVNYGDGTCDNIATITDEDGNVQDYDISTGEEILN